MFVLVILLIAEHEILADNLLMLLKLTTVTLKEYCTQATLTHFIVNTS